MRNNIHKIGIVGKGSQYNRISKILKKKNLKYFLYKPDNKKYFDKEKFKELEKCQIIFILSPNKSHFYYINKFHNKKYIFCEKPPVNTLKHLAKIKKINFKKIYFNYNFRFSTIGKILQNSNKYKLGDFLYGNIVSGHGLGFKKEYKKSWRADRKKCKKGVYEIVSVHWIDLINYFFNILKLKKPSLLNILKKGNSFDNSYNKIILKNKSEIDIFSSYSSPLINNTLFIFKNGLIIQKDNVIEIRGPALNLDKNNFVIKPKLIKKISINFDKDYTSSLSDSVNYFLNICFKKKYFKKKDFNCSIKSNKLILQN